MNKARLLLVQLLVLLLLAGAAIPAIADIDAYPFDSLAQEQRFRTLVEEFRCPKCQNQNLADSNAPLAKDLRQIIYSKVKANESDEAIASYLQDRYGDFVLYRPPVKASTLLLWFGPVLALVAVISVLVWRWRRRAVAVPAMLSEAERARLQALLQDAAVGQKGKSE